MKIVTIISDAKEYRANWLGFLERAENRVIPSTENPEERSTNNIVRLHSPNPYAMSVILGEDDWEIAKPVIDARINANNVSMLDPGNSWKEFKNVKGPKKNKKNINGTNDRLKFIFL